MKSGSSLLESLDGNQLKPAEKQVSEKSETM
jgi:hypothetical protein